MSQIAQLLTHGFTPPSSLASVADTASAGRAVQGMSVLRSLVSTCKHLMVCDQDLTSAVVRAFVETARKGKTHRVFHNVFSPWAQPGLRPSGRALECNVHVGPGSRAFVLKSLVDTIKRENAARLEHGDDETEMWFGTQVACHSLLECESLQVFVAEQLGFDDEQKRKYLAAYTSNTPEDVKLDDLRDAKRAWVSKLVIFHTSTVSVGTDFNHPHVKWCYCFFRHSILPCTQSLQMGLRCRQLSQVIVSFQGWKELDACPHGEAQVLAWVSSSHSARDLIPRGYLPDAQEYLAPIVHDVRPETDLTKLKSRSLEYRLWVAYLVERSRSRRDFMSRFIDLATRVGLAVRVVDEHEAEDVDLGTEVKSLMCTVQQARLQKMADHVEAAMTGGDVFFGARTSEERAGQEGVEIMEIFGVPLQAVQNTKWLAFWSPWARQYKLAKAYFSGQLTVARGFNLCSEPTSSPAEKIQLIRGILGAVGVTLDELTTPQAVPVLKVNSSVITKNRKLPLLMKTDAKNDEVLVFSHLEKTGREFFLDTFVAHAKRVFQVPQETLDRLKRVLPSHGMYDALTCRLLVSATKKALATIGLAWQLVYPPNQRKIPSGYQLAYAWDAQPDAVEPLPKSPHLLRDAMLPVAAEAKGAAEAKEGFFYYTPSLLVSVLTESVQDSTPKTRTTKKKKTNKQTNAKNKQTNTFLRCVHDTQKIHCPLVCDLGLAAFAQPGLFSADVTAPSRASRSEFSRGLKTSADAGIPELMVAGLDRSLAHTSTKTTLRHTWASTKTTLRLH